MVCIRPNPRLRHCSGVYDIDKDQVAVDMPDLLVDVGVGRGEIAVERTVYCLQIG